MPNNLYCVDCKKVTEHTPKLSASMDGKEVCGTCSRMNPYCLLLKPDEPNFIKGSRKVLFIEFNEDGTFKEKHDKPEIGRSLLMSPFNAYFTWQTTVMTEILAQEEGYVKFKTENSLYELYYTRDEEQV